MEPCCHRCHRSASDGAVLYRTVLDRGDLTLGPHPEWGPTYCGDCLAIGPSTVQEPISVELESRDDVLVRALVHATLAVGSRLSPEALRDHALRAEHLLYEGEDYT